ncbi:MAG: FeoB-associated Cys-rich membrane protein [Clostridia bacterium]|nr:FeoB-associated Cys-rich membrane protein [Clostridia bacterium]
MIAFFQQNWVTTVTILVLAVIVTLAIVKLVRDKKSGIGPCGKKCSQCSCSCAYTQK